MSSVIVLTEMVVSFRDVVGGKHFSFVCGRRDAGLEQQIISDLNVSTCSAYSPEKSQGTPMFTKDSHGHIALRTVTAASSKLNRAKLEAKRFTLWDFGMTLPMCTLLSETLEQLAFSLPEPPSSERISLQPRRGFCQACSEVPNPRDPL